MIAPVRAVQWVVLGNKSDLGGSAVVCATATAAEAWCASARARHYRVSALTGAGVLDALMPRERT